MAARVCSTPGCPTLVAPGARGGRCTTHQREADKARGTRTDRGYGPDHIRQRNDWQNRINAGEHVTCWRCDTPITGTAWHLGHDDQDRTITRGPECITCNLTAAGQQSRR